MAFKVGIPCMKCSLNPSQQTNKKTGKKSKTCSIESAWKEMNDDRYGRDTTIDKSLTKNNVWMEGSTSDNVTGMVQEEINRINAERKENGLRSLRTDAVSVIEIVEKPPLEYMQTLSYDEKKKYLSDSHDVMEQLIHEWNPYWKMMESVQHHDEFGGLSAHNHSLIMLTSKDKNGIATLNAKGEFNLKFFTHVNKNYAKMMREKGYDVEDCRTYDMLSEEEKEERKLHPEEHGVEAYIFKQEKIKEQEQKLTSLEAESENVSLEISIKRTALSDAATELSEKEAAITAADQQLDLARQNMDIINTATEKKKAEYVAQIKEQESALINIKNETESVAAALISKRNELSDVENSLTAKKSEIATASRQLVLTKQQIGDIQKKDADMKTAISEAERIKKEYIAKQESADNKERIYNERLSHLTGAPNIPTYNKVMAENKSLREKLAAKDRLIDSLKAQVDELKETVQEWKQKFHDISHRVGAKLMSFFGYDVSQDQTILPYPDKNVADGISSMFKEVEHNQSRQYRVIPDDKDSSKFRIAYRDDEGKYQTFQGGISTRDQAEKLCRNILNFQESATLEETVQEWKQIFHDISHRAGAKLMSFFGYDVSQDQTIEPYPDKNVADGIFSMFKEVEHNQSRQYRVIHDDKDKSKYRLVYKDDEGKYQTFQGGIATKDQAEKLRRNISNFQESATMKRKLK